MDIAGRVRTVWIQVWELQCTACESQRDSSKSDIWMNKGPQRDHKEEALSDVCQNMFFFFVISSPFVHDQKETKKNKSTARDRYINESTHRQTDGQTDKLFLGLIINLLLFHRENLQVNELIYLQSPNVSLSISGFLLEVEQITWKNVKIKVNELEGPPEDNDMCQGEHIVSLQSWKTTSLIR